MREEAHNFESVRNLENRVAEGIERLFRGEEKAVLPDLKKLIPSLLRYREAHPLEALRSTGFSGGAHKLDRYVITTAETEDEAEKAVRINDLVGETYPDFVMPTKNVGEFIIGMNFDGIRLDEPKYAERTGTPSEVIEEHLRRSIRLSTINIHSVIPEEEYEPEDYRGKLRENLSALEEVARTHIPKEIIEDFLPQYYEMASQPFWDQNLQNAKYNNEGDIKSFDWKKATRHLVIPVYEPVQIVHNFGRKISNLRALAWTEYNSLRGEGVELGFEPEEFDGLWEMGALYFMTRRIFYGHKHDNTSRIKKYIEMLRNYDFELELGQAIVQRLE